MLRVEITSSAFRGAGGLENLRRCHAFAADCGWEFGIQLHNSIASGEIERLVATGVPLSAHAPLNSLYNWNFAAADIEPVLHSVDENVRLFRRLGIRRTVFHGFFMTDLPVPAFGHGRSYDDCMREVCRPDLLRFPGFRLNADYTGTPEFRMRRDRVRDNLARLRTLHPELLFCIENDFPAYGASNMLAQDAIALESPLCLDTGHLWTTARLFELDFHREAEAFLASGQVEMIHLHASRYDDSIPLREWGDGHLPFATPNRMELPRLVRTALKAGVTHFVLEIVDGTPDDLRYFHSLL